MQMKVQFIAFLGFSDILVCTNQKLVIHITMTHQIILDKINKRNQM